MGKPEIQTKTVFCLDCQILFVRDVKSRKSKQKIRFYHIFFYQNIK
jgi:hypothetical protein